MSCIGDYELTEDLEYKSKSKDVEIPHEAGKASLKFIGKKPKKDNPSIIWIGGKTKVDLHPNTKKINEERIRKNRRFRRILRKLKNG